MANRKKLDSKTFAQQKRHRRQLITFMRMGRYGVNNFSRNAWLTVAATAVMTVTLFIVFATVGARSILISTVDTIRDKVDMSIYLKTDTDPKDVQAIENNLRKLSSVTQVSDTTPDQTRQAEAQKYASSQATLEALTQANNNYPYTLHIKVKDINDPSQLQDFVKKNATVKNDLDPNYPPSFAGSNRKAIENIGKAVNFAQKLGLVASIIFATLSILIIFNTIRMAIFNRREEIQMMKLIGADRSFVRGPFLVEAVMYGFIGALVASGLGYFILHVIEKPLMTAGLDIHSVITVADAYAGFVLLGMIVLGAIIGMISSLLATQRYLKF